MKKNKKNSSPKKVIKGYTFKDIIGKGSFGEVFMAVKNDEIYAIKLIDKAQVKKKSLEKYVENEVKVMKEFDSKYIIKMYESFQDKDFLYIVMEYCN